MLFRYLLIIYSFVILTGCSSVLNVFDDNKFFYKNGYQNVQLNSENEKIKNSHPVKIEPSRIEGALKLIVTKVSYKAEPLIQKEKLTAYSTAISEALMEAKPNEDVVFTVEGWYKKKTLSDNLVTSGRIFYNKNGLNVIFGSIMRKGQMHDTDPMLAAGINENLIRNPYVPGSRYQTIKNDSALSTIPNSGVFRPKEARGRVDWIVFTTKALQARADLTADQKKFATGANIQVQGLRDEVKQLRRELQTLRSPQSPYGYRYPAPYQYDPNRGYPYPQPAYPYPTQPPPYAYPSPNQYYPAQPIVPNSNNLSLKSLEKMRERGLISEENYFKKLRELGY